MQLSVLCAAVIHFVHPVTSLYPGESILYWNLGSYLEIFDPITESARMSQILMVH